MMKTEYRGYIVDTHPAVGYEVPAIVAEVVYLNRVVWVSELVLPSSTTRPQEMARQQAEQAIDAWLARPPTVSLREMAEQALGLELAWLEQGPLSFRVEEELEKLTWMARKVVAEASTPEEPEERNSVSGRNRVSEDEG